MYNQAGIHQYMISTLFYRVALFTNLLATNIWQRLLLEFQYVVVSLLLSFVYSPYMLLF